MDDFSAVAVTLCWGAVALVWIGAARDHGRRVHRVPTMVAGGRRVLLGAALVWAIVLALGIVAGVAVGDAWVEVLGLGVLAPATAFTIWARLALGAMWTVQARVGADHQLCTTGPYAVTRHPIYTGVLGMLLGTSLLVGDSQLVACWYRSRSCCSRPRSALRSASCSRRSRTSTPTISAGTGGAGAYRDWWLVSLARRPRQSCHDGRHPSRRAGQRREARLSRSPARAGCGARGC